MTAPVPCRFCGEVGCTGLDERGKFKKGHTLNPGGRSKFVAGIRTQLKALDPLGLQRLRDLLESDDPDLFIEGVRIWAKYRIPLPTQKVNVSQNENVLKDIPHHVLERWAREDAGDGPGNPGSA